MRDARPWPSPPRSRACRRSARPSPGAIATASARWKGASESIHSEADSFHRTTIEDFREGLKEQIRAQTDFERRKLDEWRKLLSVWQAVETGDEVGAGVAGEGGGGTGEAGGAGGGGERRRRAATDDDEVAASGAALLAKAAGSRAQEVPTELVE